MWVIDIPGQAPELRANSAADTIKGYLERDYPNATFYTSEADYNAVMTHLRAERTEWHEETQEGQDENGNPITATVQVPTLVSVGNTLSVDPAIPALLLKDAAGTVVNVMALALA